MPRNVIVRPSADSVSEEAATRFIAAAERAIRARGEFIVALAGGHTPRRLYHLLATPRFASRVEWSRVQVCWGDERCVPPGSPESNYRMAREALLSRVPVPAANQHRIRGEEPPAAEGSRYGEELRALLGHGGGRLDLVLLGVGADGHTASLFPGATSIHDSARWVEAAFHEVDERWRITMTPRLINGAAEVVFLVSGGGKAEVVARILEGPASPHALPAQLIAPTTGELVWILDDAAAAGLGPRTLSTS
jgi:6-phosphogluconolactonase